MYVIGNTSITSIVTLPKSVNSPGPVTARGIYGFVIYITSWTLFGIYLIWAYVPHEYLSKIGFTYLPSRMWAIIIPWALLFALFGGVGIYLWMNRRLVHPVSSLNLICDATNSDLLFQLQSDYKDADFKLRQQSFAYIPDDSVMPPSLDVSLDWVNKQLYLNPSYHPLP